jgi:WD40 repeat protein
MCDKSEENINSNEIQIIEEKNSDINNENQLICDNNKERNEELVNYEYFCNWDKSPKLINESMNEFNNKLNNNYIKGCKWSADGSCLLTNSEDHCLRLFNLPQNLCNNQIVFNEQIEEMVNQFIYYLI